MLASEDAESVTHKNNLSVTELLQPFSKVLAAADLGVSDADGTRTYPTSLNIILQVPTYLDMIGIHYKHLNQNGLVSN